MLDSSSVFPHNDGRTRSVPLRGGVASREHSLRRRRWRPMTSAHLIVSALCCPTFEESTEYSVEECTNRTVRESGVWFHSIWLLRSLDSSIYDLLTLEWIKSKAIVIDAILFDDICVQVLNRILLALFCRQSNRLKSEVYLRLKRNSIQTLLNNSIVVYAIHALLEIEI